MSRQSFPEVYPVFPPEHSEVQLRQFCFLYEIWAEIEKRLGTHVPHLYASPEVIGLLKFFFACKINEKLQSIQKTIV